ncbi:XrtA-associated tyrosine autokinase [Parasalinivibrio latis]|uniref:XrtA-associated tyrosine autokinase n=1 Tax=Parasalinivibrio latis TaxID=2952610 RepID=UPI0030E38CC0
MSIIEKAMTRFQPAKDDKEHITPVISEELLEKNRQMQIEDPDIRIGDQLLEMIGLGGFPATANSRRIRNEYRSIKHKLLQNAFGKGADFHHRGNVLMVTSALPGEGKTFSSVNLALSIASEQDKTVLLIDGDVLKPNLLNSMGVSKSLPGVIEYLKNEITDISEVIYSTTLPRLKVIPSGRPDPSSNELLSSERMKGLIEELANRYPDRMIIVDSPPMLSAVESVVLSRLVGQVIVVVEQDKTRMSDLKEAIGYLDDNLAIGFLVNKVVHSSFMSKYSYGQGYGYGYGHEAESGG